MINTWNEKIAFGEHIASVISLIVAYIFNDNTNIKCMAIIDLIQHIMQIVRFVSFDFDLDYSKTKNNLWFCILHSFVNDFSRNAEVTFSCFLILTLYYAYKRPISYSKYYKKYRGYIHMLIILFISSFIIFSLYEPIFNKYTPQEMEIRNNCHAAYRYKSYQYILISPLPNIIFIFPAMYCAISLIFTIKNSSKNELEISQITKRTYISFSRWIKFLIIASILCIISIIYLFIDIKNGAISNINKVEREKIDILYFFTASTGVLIMIFTLSRNQIRAKFNHDNNSIVTDYSSYGKNSYKNNNQFDNFNFSMNNSIHGRDNYVNDNGYTRNINDLSLQNNMRMNGLNKSIRDSQISSFSINNENAAMNSPSMVYFKNILTNKNEKPILHNSGARITDNGMMDNYSHYSTSPSSHNNYMSSPLAYNSYVNDVGDGSSGAGSQYYPSNNKRV
jgi:hypothetical protein